ncbi:unnamed protein product [Heligmosomoides polygyrus]|uniref:Mediator of RNA polymerase II transcription subunit 10 n=1 Tax=Heligmosomoides polygyrus TaxID=6339 RepID=A0A183G3W5_HELPZ|nr:unnamed protein product [Heligmosomoides polygyrus]
MCCAYSDLAKAALYAQTDLPRHVWYHSRREMEGLVDLSVKSKKNENARHLGVIATDFGARSQEPFNQKIHTLMSGLQELDQMRSQFMDVKVPLELLDVLDQGKNPQLYTKEVLERTLLKNKEVNGKVETYKKFHAALLKELGEEMPEDTMTYRNIRDIMDK